MCSLIKSDLKLVMELTSCFGRENGWTMPHLGKSHLILFQIAINSDSNIHKYRSRGSWSLNLRRNVQDWEFKELFDMLVKVGNHNIDDQNKDKLIWGESKEGIYIVKAGYTYLSTQPFLNRTTKVVFEFCE